MRYLRYQPRRRTKRSVPGAEIRNVVRVDSVGWDMYEFAERLSRFH